MRTTSSVKPAAAVLGVLLIVTTAPLFAQQCPEHITTLDVGCDAVDVEVSAGLGFLSCRQGGLVVADLADPSAPEVVGIEE